MNVRKLELDREIQRGRHAAFRAEQQRDGEDWGQIETPCAVKYQPLDETLGSMRVRLLRMLRWFDWVEFPQIVEALDVSPDERERNTLSSALRCAVADGLAELDQRIVRRVHRHSRCRVRWYRITAAGRRWLAKRLEVRMDVCGDEDAALETEVA